MNGSFFCIKLKAESETLRKFQITKNKIQTDIHVTHYWLWFRLFGQAPKKYTCWLYVNLNGKNAF